MLSAARGQVQRSARSRAGALACAVAVGVLAVGVSAPFAQAPAPPPAPDPDAPGVPSPPGGAEDPQEPGAEPPSGGDEAQSQSGPSKLDPFPRVTVAGRQNMRATRVTELSVTGPRGARVAVRCLGETCPMRRATATIPRAKRLRIEKAERVYRAGLTLEVRVTGEDRVGKYTKVRFRAGRTPSRTDACLQPGQSKPSPCPD